MYPEKFEQLIEELHKIQGVGAKSAERMAFDMLSWDQEKINSLIEAVQGLREIHPCSVCGALTDSDKCSVCSNDNRDVNTICVVESPRDIFPIEDLNEYNGVYHVLNGLINVKKGILPEDLNLARLEERVNHDTEEIILALNPTVEGELTAEYISRLFGDKVKVSKLASGIPIGGRVEFADAQTLKMALKHRTGSAKND